MSSGCCGEARQRERNWREGEGMGRGRGGDGEESVRVSREGGSRREESKGVTVGR